MADASREGTAAELVVGTELVAGTELAASSEQVNTALLALCEGLRDVVGEAVQAAIRYSLLGGGKRLRPTLLLAAYRAAGGAGDASALAAAVEVVHAYSLVHDDLPCMDDDEVRRGRPTTHRAFGVRVAAVAGVAMVPIAARVALHGALSLGLPRAESGAIVRELMRASGGGGMVGGQWLDIVGEGRVLSLRELEAIHRAKTGALISAAARIGALAARAPAATVEALSSYGAAVGLAFQIADDVMDATASSRDLGKTPRRDAALGKSTYPAVLGVESALARASLLADQACAALSAAGALTPLLEQLARFSATRQLPPITAASTQHSDPA